MRYQPIVYFTYFTKKEQVGFYSLKMDLSSPWILQGNSEGFRSEVNNKEECTRFWQQDIENCIEISLKVFRRQI